MKIACPHQHHCPACGDRLIHQWNRGPDESSSLLGQFVHDSVTRQTTFADADSQLHQLHFGAGPPTHRILEHEDTDAVSHNGKLWLLKLWQGYQVKAKREGRISQRSGVFIIRSGQDLEASEVTRFGDDSGHEFTRQQLGRWLGFGEERKVA